MSVPTSRHYGMDWLRIGAFQLLILYHVGMCFVPWDYQVTLATPPIDWTAIPLLLTNPWRLSLLFVVSGYASAALFARAPGLGAFLRARLARLGIPLLFGMAVIVTPQPWIWLITHHGYRESFGTFLLRDYYSFRSIDGVIVPTWMHLWFVAYLLAYTAMLTAMLALPQRLRAMVRHIASAVLASPLLLPLGIAWLYVVRQGVGSGWDDTHLLIDDGSAHAAYLPMFLFGCLLRGCEPLRIAIRRWWVPAAVLAVAAWLILAGFQIAYPGARLSPPALWPVQGLARAAEAWGAIVALLGAADRFWNVDHRWRPMLAEAVFPFYLVHQTVILLVGYGLLGTDTGPLTRFLILVAATVAGCWTFYLGGREVRWLRPLIGLRAAARARLADPAPRPAEAVL